MDILHEFHMRVKRTSIRNTPRSRGPRVRDVGHVPSNSSVGWESSNRSLNTVEWRDSKLRWTLKATLSATITIFPSSNQSCE